MRESELDRVIRPYLRDETLKVALSCYLGLGFQRAVLGVTDRRVLLVKSAYWSVRDKGLLWADPLDQVALAKKTISLYADFAYSGNTYVQMRRANDTKFRLNPRTSFFGADNTRRSVQILYSSIEGRF